MDVSFYIGELLELKGKVSVPGLGYFFYQRKNGYYNEEESKFYPPHNQIKFEPQLVDDDLALTQYIADKNGITLPSSQYFTEKYITTAKQEALIKEVPVAQMGFLYTVHGQINFKEGNYHNTDPIFFGFKPVEVKRVAYATFTGSNDNYTVAPVITSVGEEGPAVHEEQYAIAETDTGRPPMIWFIVLGAILALAISAIVLYKFFPSVFAKITGKEPVEQTAPAKAITPIIPKLNPNAGKSDSAAASNADTLRNSPTTGASEVTGTTSTPVAASTIPVPARVKTAKSARTQYVIVENFKTKADAEAEVKNLKIGGVQASLTQKVPGILFHVAIGNYSTEAEAIKQQKNLVDANAIPANLLIEKINP